MTINTCRRYTADEIADLTMLAAEARQIDTEVRNLMVELQALLDAHGATYIGWEKYHPALTPVIDAMDTDKYPFMTANTSYIPEVGHYWNSRWNPTTWRQRNKRTRRDIAAMRRAIAACEAVSVE